MTGSTGGFELRGINHLALVCRDMERTVDFYTNVLGMPLVKTIELPAGMGQHFFFDCGGGDCLAFFWFPDAPDGVPGISAPAARPDQGDLTSAIGSMNHVAFDVAPEKIEEYRDRLARRRHRLHRDRQSRRLRVGHQRRPCTRASSSAASTSRIPTASCSSSPAGCASSTSPTSPTRPARRRRRRPGRPSPSCPARADRPSDPHRHPTACPASARSPRTKPPRPSSPPCTSGSSRAVTPSPSRAAGTAPPATGGPSSPTAPTSSITASRVSASTSRPTRTLDPKLRELGQIRAGWAAGSQFVFSQHAKSMRELGMPEEQITHIPAWSVAPDGHLRRRRAGRPRLHRLPRLRPRPRPRRALRRAAPPPRRRRHPRAHLHHDAVLPARRDVQGPPHRVRRPRRSHRRGARPSGGHRHASGTGSVTAAHVVLPDDEARHTPDAEDLWNESYYCDFVQADGSMGGWLRLGLYPNRQRGLVDDLDRAGPTAPASARSTTARRSRPATASSPSHRRRRATADRDRPAPPARGVPPGRHARRPASSTRPRTSTPTASRPGARPRLDLDLTWTTDGVPYHYDAHDPLRDPLPRHAAPSPSTARRSRSTDRASATTPGACGTGGPSDGAGAPCASTTAPGSTWPTSA